MSSEQKNTRPDTRAHNQKMSALKEQLEQQHAIVKRTKVALDEAKVAKGNDTEWNAAVEEATAARKTREGAYQRMQEVLSGARAIEQDIQNKLKEIAALRTKGGRSERELNAEMERLEAQVESGSLSLVAEKQVLKEINLLKQARKQAVVVSKTQAEIDLGRAKIAEIRASVDDSEYKAAQAAYEVANKRVVDRKTVRQAENAKLDSVWAERKAAHAEIKRLHAELDAERAQFNASLAAFREQAEAERKEREDAEKEQKAAAALAKRIAAAESKVEAASLPAFGPQTAKAESLLQYFDPSYKPDAPVAAKNGLVDQRDSRQVEALPENAVVLNKKEVSAPVSRKSQKQRKRTEDSRLTVDASILADLASLNVAIPQSASDVETTKQNLLDKIQYYKDNDARVTEERLERANAELAKVKAEKSGE